MTFTAIINLQWMHTNCAIPSQVNAMNAEYARKKTEVPRSKHVCIGRVSLRSHKCILAYLHTHTHAPARAHAYARTDLHTHLLIPKVRFTNTCASENAKRYHAQELTLDAPALLLECASAGARAHMHARYAKGFMICTKLSDAGIATTLPYHGNR